MIVKDKSDYLGNDSILKLILKYSLPCILSLLVGSLYNIVDQIFIGNSSLGTLGNAATGIVFPIFIIAQAFAWCFGDGCAAYLNICQGKNETKNINKAVGNGLIITLISSVLLMALLFIFKENLLLLFGASENTLALAGKYYDIILLFFPISMISNMLNSVIRADGSPTWAMISMLCGAIINIILDPIFIFVFKMGMQGAAITTVMGQTLSFIISFIYLFHTKSFVLTKASFKFDFDIIKRVLRLGMSSFVTQMLIVIVSLVCNMMFAKYGELSHYGKDIAVSIIVIESKVYTILINIVVGIVLGSQPIISYNIGAKNYKRIKQIYLIVLLASLFIGGISTLLFEINPRFIVGLFGKPKDILNQNDYWIFGEKTFRIFLGMFMLNCFIKMSSIFFQAMGNPIKSILISVFRDIVCFIPLIIVLALNMGINGVFLSGFIADILGAILTLILTILLLKDIKKYQQADNK